MKILIVSTSRADVGSLEPMYVALTEAGHVVVWADATMSLQAKDNRIATSLLTSLTLDKVTKKIADLQPDLVMLLGDRYETLGAAVAAYVMGVPIAHLAGGDLTEGSQDDCMRHAITKLSHLHFVTNRESANRVIQMGEEPTRVHTVGSPAIDSVMSTPLLTRKDALNRAGLGESNVFFLVCMHPDTLSGGTAEVDATVSALRQLDAQGAGYAFVLIGPNKDVGYSHIEAQFSTLARRSFRMGYVPNLPRDVFLSLLAYCNALIGNSSAGFYEAPSFGTPVINVGARQAGRLVPSCVIQCDADAKQIMGAVWRVLEDPRHDNVVNPYGDGGASKAIAEIISDIDLTPAELLKKRFFTRNVPWLLTKPGSKSTGTGNGAGTQRKNLSGSSLGTTITPLSDQPSNS